MRSFEQKYGYLLRFYPASYREQRGAEMLAVLAEHGRPSMRERGALVIGGLRARLQADDDRTVLGSWSAASYLAALTLLLAGVAGELLRSTTAPSIWVWAQAVASVAAFGLAWRRRFLLATLTTAGAVLFDAIGRHGVDHLVQWEQPLAILLLLPLIARKAPAMPRWPAVLLLPVVALLELPLLQAGLSWAPAALVLLLAVPAMLVDHRVGLAVALIDVLGILDLGWNLKAFTWSFPDMAGALWPVVLAPVIVLVLGGALARRRARL
jgi:hypothetical protein